MFYVFWQQFPMGTRLSRAFVSRQLNVVRLYITNYIQILFMGLWSILRTWNVLAYPFIKSFNDLYRQICPFKARPLRLGFYICGCLPLFGFALVVIGVIYVITIALLSSIAVITAALVIVWIMVVFPVFFLWFSLYRYPVFELIYPRIRTWVLRQNSAVYKPLPASTNGTAPYIRVVRIKPGESKHQIECELVPGSLSDTSFEALSYVWGVSLFPYRIQVNGQVFYVTKNLYLALKELRRTDTERVVWIDAMAINQFDNAEKSAQVQLMGDIYLKASQIVVWLGKGSESTSAAFDFVRSFHSTSSMERDRKWTEETSSRHWGRVRREFVKILMHDWWTRAWIIQEVVAGHRIQVQRGSHQVAWEELYTLLDSSAFRKLFDYNATDFARNIQQLRAEFASPEGTSKTLVGLAYRFRHQSATFGSDKLYALLGLLRSDSSTRVIPDYSKPPEDVFLEFAVSSIAHNKSYVGMAMAAGASLQGVSWCRDWRFENDGLFPVHWFTVYPPPHRNYSAAGDSVPVYETDLKQRILSAQGFEVDEIMKYGEFNQRIDNRAVDWSLALQSWEHTAGAPFTESDHSRRTSFNRTITGDCWAEEQVDWRGKLKGRHPNAAEQNDEEFLQLVDDAGVNRRLFVTKKGRFGLGPWDIKAKDKLVVFLGGTVPFVLRKGDSKSKTTVQAQKEDSDVHGQRRERWTVIGEAYCDGAMYYEGNIHHDIDMGKVHPRFYDLV